MTIATTPAALPTPLTDRIVTVTPKGQAVRHAYRFLHTLRDLDTETRHDVLAPLAAALADRPA